MTGPKDQRADKPRRLKRGEDISRVFKEGRRAADAALTLFARTNDCRDGLSRLAVGVSKRHGNAVRRNRVKRLCREAFRLIRDELPGGIDFVVVPRVREDLSMEMIQGSLRKLASRAAGTRGGPRQ